MNFVIPNTFSISNRAPPLTELEGLYNVLQDKNITKNIKSILEFGCGITSYLLYSCIKPETYVSFEMFKPCIETVKKNVPNIKFTETDWNDLPKQKFDLIMVDSSTGFPSNKKYLIAKEKTNPYRDDAINFVLENNMSTDNSLFILHDWCHPREPWRLHRKFLEDKNYKLIFSVPGKFGFGGYRKN